MYVIGQPSGDWSTHSGYAVNDPIEGWIFTTILANATRFDTQEEASRTIVEKYPGRSPLQVIWIDK